MTGMSDDHSGIHSRGQSSDSLFMVLRSLIAATTLSASSRLSVESPVKSMTGEEVWAEVDAVGELSQRRGGKALLPLLRLLRVGVVVVLAAGGVVALAAVGVVGAPSLSARWFAGQQIDVRQLLCRGRRQQYLRVRSIGCLGGLGLQRQPDAGAGGCG